MLAGLHGWKSNDMPYWELIEQVFKELFKLLFVLGGAEPSKVIAFILASMIFGCLIPCLSG
jgi:hypothetical protein